MMSRQKTIPSGKLLNRFFDSCGAGSVDKGLAVRFLKNQER